MASELQQRVIAFSAGDEKYAGEWLTNFQRAEGAWQVCIEALRTGVPTSCDQELLQEFCAQTLGRLARSFADRLPADTLLVVRDELKTLLVLHAYTKPALIWKQLALSLTCAEIWLGKWSPLLAMDHVETCLPAPVRRELLSLPVELLFCDSALPLGDARLRATAASALLGSAPDVLPFILTLGGPSSSTSLAERNDMEDGPAARSTGVDDAGPWMRVLASWLSALRKSALLMPGYDDVAPLRCLAEHVDLLQSLMYLAAEEAADVVQELSRWRDCDAELGQLLRPLLETLFGHLSENVRREAVLPLLTELASDCWPRAVLGDFDLDWTAVSTQALSLLREMMVDENGEADPTDAEAALAIWQAFAFTLSHGTQESRSGFDDDPAPLMGVEERPEKRSRQRKVWRPSAERLAAAEALPHLFGLLAQELLQLLAAPFCPSEDDIIAVWALRVEAQSVISEWVAVVGPVLAQHEGTWAPLHRAKLLLMHAGSGPLPEDTWREVEATLWFYASLALYWPANAGAVPFATVVLEMKEVDCAPEPWKALLWSSASIFASLAPPEQCPQLVEWMLQRSPAVAGSPGLLTLIEKPYAEAMERMCKQLPRGVPHVAIGESLAAIAFAVRAPETLHPEFTAAQRSLLSAMRYALGSDSALLCQGLAQQVLPHLRQQTELEAEVAPHESDPQWAAAQSLFATLAVAAPAAPIDDPSHPASMLWSEHWTYAEAALLRWKVSSASEQPCAAAAEALQEATVAMPPVLPRAIDLLSRSVARHELPDAQIKALAGIVSRVPCTSATAAKTAQLLAAAIQGVVQVLADRPGLYDSPTTVTAFFELLAECVRASPAGTTGLSPCGDQLRPLLLAQPATLSRAIAVLDRALPECRTPATARAMLQFCAALLPEAAQETGPSGASPNGCVPGLLPSMFSPICRTMATQKLMAEIEQVAVVAEIFSRGVAFTAEFGPALMLAMAPLPVLESSRTRLEHHIANRGQFPKRTEWLEQLQHIVREWQLEVRKVAFD